MDAERAIQDTILNTAGTPLIEDNRTTRKSGPLLFNVRDNRRAFPIRSQSAARTDTGSHQTFVRT